MDKLSKQILNKRIENNPIWLMRQAGRYLPEFREIRKNNPNFIKLCLNEELSTEITLQPIKRFNFDAAIIFSDILMVPYGLGQVVEFKKNFGPILGDLNLENILEKNEEDFIKNINPVYKAINKVSTHQSLKDKDTIGFVGAPWTILMYMFNKQSPKKKLPVDLLNKTDEIKKVLEILDKFLKIHIENQVKNGATIIQIFDSWAGLLEEKYINDYIYNPTYSLVKYTQSLNVPVICFPRNIKSYKEFVNVVKPDAINIDYEVDPKKIKEQIDIPIQGGLDPKILLTDNQNIKKNALLYLDIFREHPYI